MSRADRPTPCPCPPCLAKYEVARDILQVLVTRIVPDPRGLTSALEVLAVAAGQVEAVLEMATGATTEEMEEHSDIFRADGRQITRNMAEGREPYSVPGQVTEVRDRTPRQEEEAVSPGLPNLGDDFSLSDLN